MFNKFLNSLKTPNNAALIEAIQQGYKACFETLAVEYSGIDPFTGLEKTYGGLKQSIPLDSFEPEEARKQILEEWQMKSEPSNEELEFLLAQHPKAKVNNDYIISLTKNNKVWEQLRKLANVIYPDRIKELKELKQKQAKITLLNQNRAKQLRGDKIIDPNVLKNQKKLDKLSPTNFNKLDKGLKEFANKELKD